MKQKKTLGRAVPLKQMRRAIARVAQGSTTPITKRGKIIGLFTKFDAIPTRQHLNLMVRLTKKGNLKISLNGVKARVK